MSNTPPKVLIIEDDADIVLVISSMLEDEGYDVVTANPHKDPHYLHGDDLPDVILLDMLLSGVDGREIARHLKGSAATRHIPIVIISAHPNAREEAQAAGADGFLAKPFDLDVLLNEVARYLTPA